MDSGITEIAYGVKILYEDNHIIVAIKPAGVLSQSDGSNAPDMLTILKAYIKEKYQKPGDVYLGLVHRLDRPVSGVMVFARTSKAASRLSEKIRSRKVDKIYRKKSKKLVRIFKKAEILRSKESYEVGGETTAEKYLYVGAEHIKTAVPYEVVSPCWTHEDKPVNKGLIR